MRVNEDAAAQDESLLERRIYRKRWFSHEVFIVDVRRNANDSPRRWRNADELHHGIGPHDVAVDRVLIWEYALRQRLANDDHAIGFLAIRIVKIASRNEGNTQR